MVLRPYVASLAVDGVTLEGAPGATGEVYAKGDTSFTTPLATVDASGLPVVLTANSRSVLPSFFVEDEAAVVWKSGDWIFPLVTSEPVPGDKGEPGANGTDGRDGSNVVPTAQAIATEISTEGTPANTALNATIAEQIAPVEDELSAVTAYAPAAIPATGITPANTAKFREKLTGVRAGTGTMKVLCVGDSTTAGAGSDAVNWVPKSYPMQLAPLLTSTFAPSAAGLMIPPHPSNSLGLAADPRMTYGAGWNVTVSANIGWGSGLSFDCGDADTAGNLVFTPGIECDTFDVYYSSSSDANFQAIFNLSVNGGAATVVDNSVAPTGAIKKATISTTLGTDRVLTIDPVSGNRIFVFAVEAYKATGRVRIGNAGVSGSQATHWLNDTSAYAALDCIRAYAPDLTLIMLGINDAGGSTTASTFKWRLEQIVPAARTSGDVALLSVIPSGDSREALEREYRTVALEVARKTGAWFIDINERFGTYAEANAAGLMTDTTHANAAGYLNVATAVRDAFYLA